jgi:hypothetical protein
MMRKAPASAALPEEIHGRLVATVGVCCCGPIENSERVLQPLRKFGHPLVDQIRPRSYVDWQKALDGAWANGFAIVDGPLLARAHRRKRGDATRARLQSALALHDVKLISLGGAWGRVGENETAFGYRRAKYALAIQARWANGAEATTHLAWSQRLFDAMQPHSSGKVYVNFIADEGDTRVLDAYAAQAYARLRGIKAAYDPRISSE